MSNLFLPNILDIGDDIFSRTDQDTLVGIYINSVTESDILDFENGIPLQSGNKMGQTKITRVEHHSVKEQAYYRSDATAKASEFHNVLGYIILPHITSKIADHIIREKLYPVVSYYVDPLYKGFYTSLQKFGKKELVYNLYKETLCIMATLIYHSFFNIKYSDLFARKYKHVIDDPRIKQVIAEIRNITENDSKKQVKKTLDIPDNKLQSNTETDIYFRNKQVYREHLFIEPELDDRIAVLSPSITDASCITDMYAHYDVTISVFFTSGQNYLPDDKDGVTYTYLDAQNVENHLNMYDIVIAHIQTQGNNSTHLINDGVLNLVNKKTGKIIFVCSVSLTHTVKFMIPSYDETGEHTYREVYSGEVTSYKDNRTTITKLQNHITYVSEDNLNSDYDMNTMQLFTTVVADMSVDNPSFVFNCHGLKRNETSLANCTLFGNTHMFQDIIQKTLKIFPCVRDYIREYSTIDNEEMFILRYSSMKSSPIKDKNRSACEAGIGKYRIKWWFMETLYNPNYSKPFKKSEAGNDLANHSLCICDPELKHLENYMENCQNTILMNFIAVMTYDQMRTKRGWNIIPYLSDKVYTDEELKSIIGFTDAEMKFMEDCVRICKVGSAIIDRMETGNRMIKPDENNPVINKTSCPLFVEENDKCCRVYNRNKSVKKIMMNPLF